MVKVEIFEIEVLFCAYVCVASYILMVEKGYKYKPQNKMFHFCKTFCSKITLVNTIQNVI